MPSQYGFPPKRLSPSRLLRLWYPRQDGDEEEAGTEGEAEEQASEPKSESSPEGGTFLQRVLLSVRVSPAARASAPLPEGHSWRPVADVQRELDPEVAQHVRQERMRKKCMSPWTLSWRTVASLTNKNL